MKITAFKKGTSKKMRRWVKSPGDAKQLESAIRDLQNKSIEELEKTGRVSRLNIPNQHNVYAYRVNSEERIVFVSNEEANVVADIVDTRAGKTLNGKKLFSEAKTQ